jgi:DnaJ-class molecular chaperone
MGRSRARCTLADDSIYYELLGIDRNATDDDIKKAYRKLAFLYHPDRHPGNSEAEKQFRLISRAYQYLSNLRKESNEQEPGTDNGRRPHKNTNGEPRCPGCSITGMDHISARNGGGTPSNGKVFVNSPFIVVSCDSCGHVYAVIRS